MHDQCASSRIAWFISSREKLKKSSERKRERGGRCRLSESERSINKIGKSRCVESEGTIAAALRTSNRHALLVAAVDNTVHAIHGLLTLALLLSRGPYPARRARGANNALCAGEFQACLQIFFHFFSEISRSGVRTNVASLNLAAERRGVLLRWSHRGPTLRWWRARRGEGRRRWGWG